MPIKIQDGKTKENIPAIIKSAEKKDMPLKKSDWQFAWKKLYETEGGAFYKLALLQSKSSIEGLLMLTLMNNEMLYLNNIEVAPHNIGKNGKYALVAGCLLAFACTKSFELGKGHYLGYLSFDSKTALIELYQERYGATWVIGQKMFFDPKAGLKLMDKYLK